MQKKNPYKTFIDVIRKQGAVNNPSSLCIGLIKSINPLQIDYKGLPLMENNLYINKKLLDYTENIEATTEVADEHTHSIKKITHKSILEIGNSVILYPMENGQKYLVLCVI